MEKHIDKPEFAEFVRNMRKSINLSQHELADSMGLSITSIIAYENEKHARLPRRTSEFIYDLREVVKAVIKERRLMG